MPNNFWTVQNAQPGRGSALNGLQIQQVTSGTPPVVTGYQIANGQSQGKSYSGTQMPVVFNNVEFAQQFWNITANIPTAGVNGPGTWVLVPDARHPEDTGDNGEFTAQAGTGIDPETASSANV
jgi:hypothetical protein